jgi:hypothetical protein
MQEAEHDLATSSEFLLSVIHDVKPDLAHFNQYGYGALEVDIPRVVVAHSDVVSWWVCVHGEEPRETKWLRWYRELVTQGLSNATAVVAPSTDAIRDFSMPMPARKTSSSVSDVCGIPPSRSRYLASPIPSCR